MSTADEFLKLFDDTGRFRAREGAVDVVFLTNMGRSYPGRLEFRDGLCISADMEGSPAWVYPDGSPLDGLRLLLAFDRGDPLVLLLHEGRVLTPDALHADARLAEVFAEADRSGIAINQRARAALLSLSLQEQTAVLEAVIQLAKQPSARWSPSVAPRVAEDKPVYLLKISEDLRVFLRVGEGRQGQQVELFDIVREATLRAFLDRYRVTSGAK